MTERKIHQSMEAEQAVLGALLIDNEALERVSDVLTVEDFYHDAHRVIYQHILTMVEKGEPADIVTVSASIEAAGHLPGIGGFAYIVALAESVPSVLNARYYAGVVLEKYTLRKIDSLTHSVTSETQKSRNSMEIIELVNAETQKLSDRKHSLNQGFKVLKALLLENIQDLTDLTARSDFSGVSGLPTGLLDLDQITSGMQPGDLIVVAGRPSMGKTALAMNIAESAAVQEKKTVAVFSMEMQSKSISARILGSVAKVNSEAMRNGRLSDTDWERLSVAIGKINEAPLHIDETPALSVLQLAARAKRLRARVGDIGLIVVDYIQLMATSSTRKSDTKANEVAEITRGLKALAKELNCPIIALSQLNRNLELRPNKRPIMSDLRESGAIEQDADVILFIYRDEVYHPDSDDKGIAEIIIAKQRNGRVGTIKTAFQGEYTRFTNLIINNNERPF